MGAARNRACARYKPNRAMVTAKREYKTGVPGSGFAIEIRDRKYSSAMTDDALSIHVRGRNCTVYIAAYM